MQTSFSNFLYSATNVTKAAKSSKIKMKGIYLFTVNDCFSKINSRCSATTDENHAAG